MGEIGAPQLISLHDGYARFGPVAFSTIASLVSQMELVMRECQQFNRNRLVVDFRAMEHPPLSTTDRYDLGNATAEFWDRSILVAVVMRPEQIDPDRFGQRVAGNRGFFVSVGTDEAAAIEWLLQPRGLAGPASS